MEKDNPNRPNNHKRRRALLALSIVFIVGAIAYGIYWGLIARFRETTDDAYVAGNIVQVMPQIAGTVTSIAADDTDLVQQGQTLITLDKSDVKIALDRAENELAQSVRQVRNLFAGNSQLQAAVALRQVELDRTQADLKRREGVISQGGVSQEELLHARNAVAAAKAALAVAMEQLHTNQALIADTTIAQHPAVQTAAARVRDAYLTLQRTSIVSPTQGYVAKRSVQIGNRVNPGAPLMAVVPLNELWVDANFKEVQLRNLRIGQPVTLTADIYGDKIEYRGKVIGLSMGTGSAFSLLPAQNATGNWIKVVQRLPVRIAIDSEDLAKHPLRIGLSMQVIADIHDQNGPILANAPRSAPAYTTPVFDKGTREADLLIADIIRANAGKTNVGELVEKRQSSSITKLNRSHVLRRFS